jgi:hypothetical protein
MVLFVTFNGGYLGERACSIEDLSVELLIFVGEVISNDSLIAEVSSSA